MVITEAIKNTKIAINLRKTTIRQKRKNQKEIKITINTINKNKHKY